MADAFRMTIEYGNSQHTYAHRGLLAARAAGALMAARDYYQRALLMALSPVLGITCAYAAWTAYASDWFLLIAIALAMHAFLFIKRWKTYGRYLRDAFFHAGVSREQKRIRMEFSEDGLREHQGDIVSFAPWKDVASAWIKEDLLVIVLRSGQEAMIPHESPGIRR